MDRINSWIELCAKMRISEFVAQRIFGLNYNAKIHEEEIDLIFKLQKKNDKELVEKNNWLTPTQKLYRKRTIELDNEWRKGIVKSLLHQQNILIENLK